MIVDDVVVGIGETATTTICYSDLSNLVSGDVNLIRSRQITCLIVPPDGVFRLRTYRGEQGVETVYLDTTLLEGAACRSAIKARPKVVAEYAVLRKAGTRHVGVGGFT